MLARFLTFICLLTAPQSSDLPVTVERYLQLRKLSDLAVSPDGAQVAFIARGADSGANEYRSVLHLWSERGTRVVSQDFVHAFAPRWAPDGAILAFLSEGPSSQADPRPIRIWGLRPSSGLGPTQIGDLPGGVLEYVWAPSGVIFALIRSEAGGREFWQIDVGEGTSEYLWGGTSEIRDIAISPDGSAIVFSSNATATSDTPPSYNLRLLDLDSKRTRELTNRPGSELGAVWSPDGTSIVFRAPHDPANFYSQPDLFAVDVARRGLRNLTESFDRAVLDHSWPAGGDLLFTAAVGPESYLFAWRGGAVEMVSGDGYDIGDFAATASGTPTYAVRESATEPTELWRLDRSSEERLTHLNQFARDWRVAHQEIIRWQAPDGLTIEGLLTYPANYEPGQRYPLLVDADGGPLERVRDVLQQPSSYQLFAAQGYAVLAVNYRGSIGYGEQFGSAPRDDLAGGDFVDLSTGIDHVIDSGVADPDRIAVFGGARTAYGAHLAALAITRTRRFKAAVAIYDAPTRLLSGGDGPAAARDIMAADYSRLIENERQPLASIENVRTPLLLFEGEAGSLVSQPQRLHEALSQARRTVELASLPESAERWTPGRQREFFFRQLRWFDKYLKFGGADLFDFYLVGEWVPGPGGWQLRIDSAAARSDYSGLQPSAGRYLEIALTLEPSQAALHEGTLQDFQLDPASAIVLLGPDSIPRTFAGTVTQLFGRETLVLGLPNPIKVMATGPGGAPTAVATRLAFEVPDTDGVYRLLVTGFVPIRIWVADSDQEGEGDLE
ncbi:MAG: prolyl oligopeptidase family serine peptidase [Gemmatimonadales bacterium]|jgi:dipeptidyl aminopeptidase/acylaminoacyl peptidase